MMITKENFLVHEFIGLEAEVVSSNSKEMIGVKGKVVDETKCTFEIESKNKVKIIPKKSCIFRFMLPRNEFVKVDGKLIAYRPEDRPKKLFKFIRG
jgi:ribonuclease P protein subunit POP4